MKKAWKWVIGVAVLLVMSPMAYEAVSLELQTRALHDSAATATRFLKDMDAHDYLGAYALLDAPQQRVITVATLGTTEEQIERKHGKPLGQVDVDEYNLNQRRTKADLFCSNTYQKDDGIWIHIILTSTSAGWRVSEYQYDFSPA